MDQLQPALSRREKMRLYYTAMKGLMNTCAVFSDESENFQQVTTAEAGVFAKIYLRTAKDDVDHAVFVSGENRHQMALEKTEGMFDYFVIQVKLCQKQTCYQFDLEKDGRHVFYTKLGFFDEPKEEGLFSVFQQFSVPAWAQGAVMYQIYVDRFCKGSDKNSVVTGEYAYLGAAVQRVEDWSRLPENDDFRSFYGGDLLGVMEKLDYLKDLGVEVIYFNPIFVSPSSHKYDTQDYNHIDPHLAVIAEDGGVPLREGQLDNKEATMYQKRSTDAVNLAASDEFFRQLVEKAHEKGIRVLLDGVFNHCGAFSQWLDREGIYAQSGRYAVGAYQEKNSPYHDYFLWREDRWPDNDRYEGWWGYENHPKLNYNSKALYQTMLEIGKKWVSPPFCADGWRLDVAADLGADEHVNHKFWKDFRQEVKKANPDALILAEHYGDPSSWLDGQQWDSVMNYDAFMEPISWFLTGMEKHSDRFEEGRYNNAKAFEECMRYTMARLPGKSLMCAMNQLSNHDHSRFYTRTNRVCGRLMSHGSAAAAEGLNKGCMKEGILFQMTWIGSPTIYYGDEAGVVGWTDPDNRRTYPWGNQDGELLEFHRALIEMRREREVFRRGSLKYLRGSYGMISYGRFTQKEIAAVILNNTDAERTERIPVWEIGAAGEMDIIFTSRREGFTRNTGETLQVEDGCILAKIPSYGGIVVYQKRRLDET